LIVPSSSRSFSLVVPCKPAFTFSFFWEAVSIPADNLRWFAFPLPHPGWIGFPLLFPFHGWALVLPLSTLSCSPQDFANPFLTSGPHACIVGSFFSRVLRWVCIFQSLVCIPLSPQGALSVVCLTVSLCSHRQSLVIFFLPRRLTKSPLRVFPPRLLVTSYRLNGSLFVPLSLPRDLRLFASAFFDPSTPF